VAGHLVKKTQTHNTKAKKYSDMLTDKTYKITFSNSSKNTVYDNHISS